MKTRQVAEPPTEAFPAAPHHLSPRGRQLWGEVGPTAAKTAGRQALLQAALECLDTADAARRLVEAEGLIVKTERSGVAHVHPGVRVEREARGQFARIWKELGLGKVAPVKVYGVKL